MNRTYYVGSCPGWRRNQVSVIVHPRPIAKFLHSPEPANREDPTVEFIDQSIGATKWLWDFDDGVVLEGLLANLEHTYDSENREEYWPTLIVENEFGCRDSTDGKVTFGPLFTFYIPNTFTPNQTNTNDLFYGQGIGIKRFELRVFDRWGEVIFYSNDIEKGWDGTVLSENAQEDVYAWMVTLTDAFDKEHKYIGQVTLIR